MQLGPFRKATHNLFFFSAPRAQRMMFTIGVKPEPAANRHSLVTPPFAESRSDPLAEPTLTVSSDFRVHKYLLIRPSEYCFTIRQRQSSVQPGGRNFSSSAAATGV